jgi:hypothetical protein
MEDTACPHFHSLYYVPWLLIRIISDDTDMKKGQLTLGYFSSHTEI